MMVDFRSILFFLFSVACIEYTFRHNLYISTCIYISTQKNMDIHIFTYGEMNIQYKKKKEHPIYTIECKFQNGP